MRSRKHLTWSTVKPDVRIELGVAGGGQQAAHAALDPVAVGEAAGDGGSEVHAEVGEQRLRLDVPEPRWRQQVGDESSGQGYENEVHDAWYNGQNQCTYRRIIS